MSGEIQWVGNEDEQFAERLKACKARRKRYGQGSCFEKDGSCDACEWDMAVALRDTPERRNKLGLPTRSLPTPDRSAPESRDE